MASGLVPQAHAMLRALSLDSSTTANAKPPVRQYKRSRGGGADPGWSPCLIPCVRGWRAAMCELQRLGRENMSGLPWKVGCAKTNHAKVTYVYKCSFSNVQGCPFCVRLIIERGGISTNPHNFVHVGVQFRDEIHQDHVIRLEYTSGVSHINHSAPPKMNQGPPLRWVAACQDNPLCLRFNRAQIVEWLHHNKLLPGGPADERVMHACKKWAERIDRRGK